MLEQDFRALNSRIDSLIQKIQALSAENHNLKQTSGDTRQLKAQLESLEAEVSLLKLKKRRGMLSVASYWPKKKNWVVKMTMRGRVLRPLFYA